MTRSCPASGSGFSPRAPGSPFASLLRDPETYENFDRVIVTHTCREVAELTYSKETIGKIRSDELFAELIGEEGLDKLVYYPTTTREESPKMGRITELLKSGVVFRDLGLPEGMSPDADRAMVCGSMGLNLDLKDILEGYGLREGANSEPAEYVVEKAFVG